MMTWGVRVEPSPPSPPEDSSGLPAQGTKILAVDSADEAAPPVPSEVSPLPPEEARTAGDGSGQDRGAVGNRIIRVEVVGKGRRGAGGQFNQPLDVHPVPDGNLLGP